MGDLLRIVLDSIEFLWPFRQVQPWERALYVVCNRWTWEIGPGVYLMCPWFVDVKPFSVATAIVGTPRLDVTMKDGTTLTFSATACARVVDGRLALYTAEEFKENAQELLASVLAEKIAEADPERFVPEKRGRLFTSLLGQLQREGLEFGVEFTKLRFTNFVHNVRTYRLLQDTYPAASW